MINIGIGLWTKPSWMIDIEGKNKIDVKKLKEMGDYFKERLNEISDIIDKLQKNGWLMSECYGAIYSLSFYKRGVETKNDLSMHKSHKKGEFTYHKGIKFQYNEDYYTLEVFKKEQTIDLLKKIPIRHPEKIAKRKLVFQIYDQGIVRWELIEERVKSLKQTIQESVKSKTLLNLEID